MLESRSQLGPDKISQLNREICKNLGFIWNEAKAPKSDASARPFWAGYKSFSWEADPQLAILEVASILRWVYPRVLNDQEIEFFEPSESVDGAIRSTASLPQGGTRWLKNSWGIWEPDPQTATKISLDECVGILVPGVAFDRKGHRLGYGKGFYDRALENFRGLKVGVGFSMQVISETLPNEAFDIAMDMIVTDREIIHVRNING